MQVFSKSYIFPFPVELVYAAWVSSDTVIPPASRMEIDATPGGIYRLTMPNGAAMEGVFSDVVPNERVRYSWRWIGSSETTEVDIRFGKIPAGTEIKIEHCGFQTAASLDNHAAGWDNYIAGLESHLSSTL